MEMGDIEKLRRHLSTQYAGVFDEQMINQHISEYVDTSSSELLANQLVERGHRGQKMLDIGSGYGSIVLAARREGIDAIGLELAEFEVEFARERLRKERPQDNPELVYRQGDALKLPFPDTGFDVLTIMNVLEHVPDYRKALAEAARVLRPGGCLYVLCPNYAAFRCEAHYLVPWVPLLPRSLAVVYLKAIGRNPGFFENSIYYCTNWGILRTLSKLPLVVGNPLLAKLDNLSLIANLRVRRMFSLLKRPGLLSLARRGVQLWFYNPLKQSVWFYATKKGG